MKENKIKKIEEQLRLLFSQADKNIDKKSSPSNVTGSIKVIRRRKGKPDFYIV